MARQATIARAVCPLPGEGYPIDRLTIRLPCTHADLTKSRKTRLTSQASGRARDTAHLVPIPSRPRTRCAACAGRERLRCPRRAGSGHGLGLRGQGPRGLVRQRADRPPLPGALLRGSDRRDPGRPARVHECGGDHLARASGVAPERARSRRPRSDSRRRSLGRTRDSGGPGDPDDPTDPDPDSEATPDVDTTGISSVPIPLLVLGGMSIMLLAAGGLGYLSRRRAAARATTGLTAPTTTS